MSISRLTVSWLAGAKVADISIHSKHICLFFETFLKQFRKWLIDKDVVEHKFERERGKELEGGTLLYMRARNVRVDRGGEKYWENLKAEDWKCKAKV